MELFEDFNKLVFVFAKTIPDQPHEYVVRTADNEAAYVRLFELIAAQGVVERFGRRRYRYWYPGDGWKYWAMTTVIGQSRIINRAQLPE